LKVLIETLLVAPQGNRPKMLKTIEYMKEKEADHTDVTAHMTQLADHADRSRRYFAVGFRGSEVRVVFSDENDPLQYKQQITGKDRLLQNHDPDHEESLQRKASPLKIAKDAV
jgi:hypothetical protein